MNKGRPKIPEFKPTIVFKGVRLDNIPKLLTDLEARKILQSKVGNANQYRNKTK